MCIVNASNFVSLAHLNRDSVSQHWHRQGRLAPCIPFSPHRCHSLDLGVEVETLLPVEVSITKEASPGSSERHHWQRDRNGNIHPNLSDINVCSELPCSCTIRCENSCSISCTIGLHSMKCVQKLNHEFERLGDECKNDRN